MKNKEKRIKQIDLKKFEDQIRLWFSEDLQKAVERALKRIS